MANEDYKVDYNDPRLTKIEAEKNAAIKESDATYDNMINQSDSFFQSQIDAVNQYGETQKKNQQAETDFTIEKIEQEKDQAHKDYLKEQSASYVDWQKQSNKYGVNAEQMAAGGLSNTGYSESSQVSMYNTYQNRVVAAREAYNKAVLNYNNAITEARLQNNSLLAEIAFNTLKTTTQLSLKGFQYENELIDKKLAAKTDISNNMWNRYADTLSLIHSENSLAETIRSNKAQEAHNKSVLAETIRSNKASEAHQAATLAENKRQYNLSYELEKKNLNNSGGGSGSGGGTGVNNKDNSAAMPEEAKNAKRETFSTYEEAAAYMKKIGAITGGDGGLMTRSEWARRKSAGSTAAEAQYSSYSEYLTNFVAWRKANPLK